MFRGRLRADLQRGFSAAISALDQGADRLAQAARRWSRDETASVPTSAEGYFVLGVLAFMGGGAMISALALIAFAPR